MNRFPCRRTAAALGLCALTALVGGCASGRGYSIATTAPYLNQEEPGGGEDDALVFIADGQGGLSAASGVGGGAAGGPDLGGARYAAGNLFSGPFSGHSTGFAPALLSGGLLGRSGLGGAVANLAAVPVAALSAGPGGGGGANLVVASLNTQSSHVNPSLGPGGVSTGGGSVGVDVGLGTSGLPGPAVGVGVSTPGVSVTPGGVSTGAGVSGFLGGVTGGALGVTVGVGPATGGLGGLVSIGTTSSGSGLLAGR